MLRNFLGSAPQIEFVSFANRLFLVATFPSIFYNGFGGHVQCDAQVYRETVVFEDITVQGNIEVFLIAMRFLNC